MLDCLDARAQEITRHLIALVAQLPGATDTKERATMQQAEREARGRLSVYTPALALISSPAEAREYLERVSGEAVRLLHDIKHPGETLNETESAAPMVSGFYHETRYALALLDTETPAE